GSEEHRFLGVWPVVVKGRVFARSWDQRPNGWYHVLRAERRGTIQIGEREIPVRAILTRSERLKAAVDRAYATKFTTPGALKFVRGFKLPRRRNATIEFVPTGSARGGRPG